MRFTYLYNSINIVKSTGEHRRGSIHVHCPFSKRAHLHVSNGCRFIDGYSVLFPGTVLPAHVSILRFGRHPWRFDEPPE